MATLGKAAAQKFVQNRGDIRWNVGVPLAAVDVVQHPAPAVPLARLAGIPSVLQIDGLATWVAVAEDRVRGKLTYANCVAAEKIRKLFNVTGEHCRIVRDRRSMATRRLSGKRLRLPIAEMPTPCAFRAGQSTQKNSSNVRISSATSVDGRSQFSVENVNSVSV